MPCAPFSFSLRGPTRRQRSFQVLSTACTSFSIFARIGQRTVTVPGPMPLIFLASSARWIWSSVGASRGLRFVMDPRLPGLGQDR